MCYTLCMAYRITATTETDKELLDDIRDLAWRQRCDISQIIREAFQVKLHGHSAPCG